MSKADLDKRPADVSAMFDRVSRQYDITNDVLSMGVAPYWRTRTRRAIDPKPTERILDVAAGTGTVSRILADEGAVVTALDFSAGMIAEGIRCHGDHPRIEFVQGDATDLPFDDNTFDATTVSFGLRNVQEPRKALAEMFRVTRPGGRIVICEFSTPPNAVMNAGYNAYMSTAMPAIVKLVSSDPEAYDYLFDSIKAWPDQRTLAGWLRDAGYTDVAYRNLTYGISALHRGTKPLA
ncbi:class I SAM-dependent methyltransferase [Gulosibacter macacae]|uniref:Demethylmenaquinone methyltransferase n=1 Tax=Gulosibacter macacae TaxID=2488791 RepID=A0A3P3VT77_9MICO|nr:class I SAM-dependent methyltransferase [Gulosibacter macacae]RRJ86022.1 class I SAM-dependent methyltransferase [Gulosibacter macacae]